MRKHTPISEEMIQQKAYELWLARGCPEGTAEEDWYAAELALRQAGKAEPPPAATSEVAPAAVMEEEPAPAQKPAPKSAKPQNNKGKKYGLRKI
jgi:hypothetical protein